MRKNPVGRKSSLGEVDLEPESEEMIQRVQNSKAGDLDSSQNSTTYWF